MSNKYFKNVDTTFMNNINEHSVLRGQFPPTVNESSYTVADDSLNERE